MNTLREAITACSDAQLQHIYHLWGISKQEEIEASPAHTTVNTFFERIADPIAARFVWPALSTEQSRTLFYLVSPAARNGITLPTVQRRVPIEDALPGVLATLKENCFIYEMPGKKASVLTPYVELASTLYHTGLEYFAQIEDLTQSSLMLLINHLTENEVRHIVRNIEIEQAEHMSIYQLRGMLSNELLTSDFTIVSKLTAEQRNLLKTLCNTARPLGIEAIHKQAGISSEDTDALYHLLHTFTNYGLAFDTFSEERRVVFVPKEIKAALKEALVHPPKPRPKAGLQLLTELPKQQAHSSAAVLFDIAIVINAVYQQTIQPTQSGTLPKRITNKMRPLTNGLPRYSGYDDDDGYLTIVFNTATTLSLVHCPTPPVADMKPTYAPADQLEQWTTMTLVEQGRQLIRYWSEYTHNRWTDVVGENYTRDYYAYDYYSWSPLQMRKTLLTYLRRCTPGQWYRIDSLLETIWQEAPNATPKYGQQKSKSTEKEREKWLRQQGEVYTGMLASSLYEFGLVDLGYDRESEQEAEQHHYNPDAFLVNELGAEVLTELKPAVQLLHHQHNAATATENRRTLIVQPNFELLLLEPAMPTLYSVLPFAQVEQINQVSRLTLTRNSLLRGMASGLDLETIIATLTMLSAKELPQNVDYTLRDWAKLYKGARVSTTVLIEVSSEAIAEELYSSGKLKSLSFRRVGSRALATPKDINTVRNALDKEGIAVSFGATSTQRKGYSSNAIFTFDTSQ